MSEKVIKTRSEWKGLINEKLTPEEFQDLSYDIVCRNGFRNVKQRGRGGDGGRDIEAEFLTKIGKDELTERFWFQCKNQKKGVNFSDISTEVQKAQDQGTIKFVILSNVDTTPACKDDLNNWNNKNKCQILDWSGSKFLDLLFELPNICKAYFPDEEVPLLTETKDSNELIAKSNSLGERFGIELEIKVDKPLKNVYEIADFLKEKLINLRGIDINLKALIYQKMAMFFYSAERVEDAIMFLNQSLDITPKNTEALLNKGFILEREGETGDSTKCYNEILKLEPQNKFALNNKAHNLSNLGEFNEALSLIEKAIAEDSEFVIARQTKVEILRGLNRKRDALTFLEERKDLLEKSVNLQLSLVSIYIDFIDLRKAFELNEKILATQPENIEVINNKGVIYEKNSKFQFSDKYLKLALAVFNEVINKNKKFPLGWSNKAVILINSKKPEESEAIINEAYSLFPKNAHVLNKRGLIFLIKGKFNEAIKYFDKSLRLQFQEETLLNKAKAQMGLNHWKEAIASIDGVLKNNSEKGEAWWLKGQSLRKIHEPKRAEHCFKKAEELKEKAISLLEDETTSATAK
ncbi:MAG: DUF3808 domain-containing protein [Nanoarchaeota archaeon]|nr:DUF3808 domain-containing protein [Nanoarchaeota archaeon]